MPDRAVADRAAGCLASAAPGPPSRGGVAPWVPRAAGPAGAGRPAAHERHASAAGPAHRDEADGGAGRGAAAAGSGRRPVGSDGLPRTPARRGGADSVRGRRAGGGGRGPRSLRHADAAALRRGR